VGRDSEGGRECTSRQRPTALVDYAFRAHLRRASLYPLGDGQAAEDTIIIVPETGSI